MKSQYVLGILFTATVAICGARAAEGELKPIFYVSFEGTSDAVIARGESKAMMAVNRFEEGVVGKAGVTSGRTIAEWEGRGNLCLDRGTMAVFYKPDHDIQDGVFGGIALGVNTCIEGYWGRVMLFNMMGEQFAFDFYDVGRYTQRLPLQSNVGRWKKGEWVHLAAVWDRNEGVKVYEGGKLVASNWGKYHWKWNNDPTTLWAGGNSSVDELYVFGDCLTDEQVAQLAKGQKPTGAPIPASPGEKQRVAELERMGWTESDLAEVPQVEAGKPQQFVFARFLQTKDDGRLEARPFDGLKASAWPNPGIAVQMGRRERRLDMTLAPNQTYDRVRLFAQRPFEGELIRVIPDIGNKLMVKVQTERPIWRASLGEKMSFDHLSLLRHAGWIGQIDFYRVEMTGKLPSGATLKPLGDLARLDKLPATDAGKAAASDTPSNSDHPIRATTQTTPSWQIQTPSFEGFQVLSEPLAEQGAFDGVLVTLVANKMDGATPVRVVVKEPVFTQRDWMVADAVLVPKGEGRQVFTLLLKGRPVLNTKGIELPILVTTGKPVTWAMGKDGSGIGLCVADLAKARPIAVDDQVEFARDDYSESSEGRYTIWSKPPSSWLRGYVPLAWLRDYAPDDRRAMQMLSRLGWRKEILPYTNPKNETGAPDWAFWQWQAMKESRRIKNWWIDNRQMPCGEFGHGLGDDTDLVENWADAALAYDGDDEKIKNALRRIYDAAWEEMDCGASRTIRDNLHSYEEGCGTIAQHLLIDYGDPIAFERCMASSSHLEKWMKSNLDGTFSFRSWMMGAPGVWEFGRFAQDRPGNNLLLIPAAYQMWYSQHPTATRYLTKWKLIGEKGAKAGIPYEAFAKTLDKAAHDRWWQERLASALQSKYAFELASTLDELGTVPEEIRKKILEKAKKYYGDGKLMEDYRMSPDPWSALVDNDTQWLAYWASKDTAYLADSYRQVCMFINNSDWLHTVGQTNGDRCPLPRLTLARARMGASAAHRGGNASWWPRYGITYVRGATETAALVTENTEQKLTARFFAFTDQPHKLRVRLWRLDPGMYKLTLSSDPKNDGQPGSVIDQRELEVVRGIPVDLTLPPKQGTVLTLIPLKTKPADFCKADPAISARTLELDYGEHLQITVHNIGSKPVENLLVRVRDGRSGNTLFEKRIPHLDAPLDFKPKTAMVEVQNINCATYGTIIVELDPNHEVDDLNPFNNTAVFKY